MAKERPYFTLPLTDFRAEHLDSGGLSDGLAIVDVYIIAAATGHDGKVGSMSFELLRVEFVKAWQHSAR